VFALVVDVHHARMVDLGDGPGLPLEPAPEARVRCQPGVHHLDRDLALQPQVGPPVDPGHATDREQLSHPIALLQEHPGQIGLGCDHVGKGTKADRRAIGG